MRPNEDTQRYKIIRWLFLSIAALAILMSFYKLSDVGNVSNIYARFYNVGLAEVDVLLVAFYFGSGLSMLFVIVLNACGHLKSRAMFLLSLGTLTLGFFIGLISDIIHSFSVLVVGRLIIGISYRLSVVIGWNIAYSWFQLNEVTVSLAIVNSGIFIGQLLASIVPVNILQVPPPLNQTNSTHSNDGNNEWFYHNLNVFAVQDGILITISIIIFTIVFILFKPTIYENYKTCKTEIVTFETFLPTPFHR